jgi:hypothetical protein
VDNTKTKFFLSVEDESALWAAKQFGMQKTVKRTVTIGQNIDRTDTGAKENTSHSFREDLEDYLTPVQMNLLNGYGFAKVFFGQDKQISGPMRVGYIDEKDLCSDEELMAFIKEAAKPHKLRPRNGSLIDNNIDPGPEEVTVGNPPAFHEPQVPEAERARILDDGLLRKIKAGTRPVAEHVLSPNAVQEGTSSPESNENSVPQNGALDVEAEPARKTPKDSSEDEDLQVQLRVTDDMEQDAPSGNHQLDQFVAGLDEPD